MSANEKVCPLCRKEFGNEDIVSIGHKGAEGINKASIERSDSIVVSVGTLVHKSCRLNYINKKDIEKHKKGIIDCHKLPVKRSARILSGPFNSNRDCLYCEKEIITRKTSPDYADYSYVTTQTFAGKMLAHCKARGDEWSSSVQGRIEYFFGELVAANCIYHHSCDVNFRTGRNIPVQYRSGTDHKRSKAGRPTNSDQEQAFLKTCYYFECNDEEQLTLTDLVNKMAENLEEVQSVPYGKQYLKSKLLEYYGDSLFIAEDDGLHDIVTFRHTSSRILRDYVNEMNKYDEEAHKKSIIETAAKLIRSDIKTSIKFSKDNYPTTKEINLESALEYIPDSLHMILKHLLMGNDKSRKIASIGQAIVQAVRPRSVIAPLQIGLAVQMYHHFRSRFLIDNLYAMGYCSSYSEVLRFQENAASSVAPDILGSANTSSTMVLFAADNVDHNIVTLDGKGTFHGMGMIASVTPGQQIMHTVSRRKISELNIINQTEVNIMDYRFAESTRRTLEFDRLHVLTDLPHDIDIMWEVSFCFRQPVSNWQGFMHLAHKKHQHPGQSSVVFLPMIDMSSSDKTCIFSTLNYVCKLASKYDISPVVTFDQPLFWKASEIINEVLEDSPLRSVVLLLGSFHTLMNLLGAIGTLMDGSGIADILGTIYGENTVMHMLNGKAVQKAVRGHLLVSQCLTKQIVSRVIESDPGFSSLLQELEEMYTRLDSGTIDLDSLVQSECFEAVKKQLCLKKNELINRSCTSKLWLNYAKMLETMRELLEADRTGSWDMHLHALYKCLPIFAAAGHANYLKSSYLYLQNMKMLDTQHPEVYHKFHNGFHVVRRSDKYWAGLGSDLVIEQTLMRSLKSTGGLTRGSGMTEHQRAVWTMSAPICSSYNYAMQNYTNTAYTTSEQHKEATTSRMERDTKDLGKLSSKFDEYTPFSEETTLRNIITGINADKDVNVLDLFDIGNTTIRKMEGQSVFQYSFKRKDKVRTLATSRCIKVSKNHTIDPSLLFQRFLVVSQSGELNLDDIMRYELSPYPLSLFDEKYLMRKPNKAQLQEALSDSFKSSELAVLQYIPKTDHYVLDGGSLLHRLKWKEGSTYTSIANDYSNFTLHHYGLATVVFDGYNGRPNTKDHAHLRRTSNVAKDVDIREGTKFSGKMEEFLCNDKNKQALINLISDSLRKKGCHVVHAEGDADVDIVKATVEVSASKSTTLIGEDTDLLVLLLYHTTKDCKDLYFRSDKGKAKKNVYNIKVLKQLLGDNVCCDLLFSYAFSGCDTTSGIFGVGKKSVFRNVIRGDPVLQSCSKIFCTPNTDPNIVETTGCKAMVSMFHGEQTESLLSLRHGILCRKVSTADTFVKPERLPPTPSAAKFHSRRVYLQVMQWLGKSEGMDPTNWGWFLKDGKLLPEMMDISPAPENLLQMVRCNCSGRCNTMRCSCKKLGLECTRACGKCQISNCENTTRGLVSDEEDL
jgi:hypothetical protein